MDGEMLLHKSMMHSHVLDAVSSDCCGLPGSSRAPSCSCGLAAISFLHPQLVTYRPGEVTVLTASKAPCVGSCKFIAAAQLTHHHARHGVLNVGKTAVLPAMSTASITVHSKLGADLRQCSSCSACDRCSARLAGRGFYYLHAMADMGLGSTYGGNTYAASLSKACKMGLGYQC